jgi:hypothetical protein
LHIEQFIFRALKIILGHLSSIFGLNFSRSVNKKTKQNKTFQAGFYQHLVTSSIFSLKLRFMLNEWRFGVS